MIRFLVRVSVAMTLALSTVLPGCKDKPADSPGSNESSVALLGSALNADGSINAQGLKEIEGHAKDAKLHVVFVRAPLTDVGLAQLSKFPNIVRIDAAGSKITDQGIAKLKSAIPAVEVMR